MSAMILRMHTIRLANGIAQGRCVALDPVPLWAELVRSSKPGKLDLKAMKFEG